MARTISKNVATATIYVLDPNKAYTLDNNGMPIANVTIDVNGAPSRARAERIAREYCDSKNVMVMRIDVDETKLNVDPDTFILNSSVCAAGATYGREYKVQTFDVMHVTVFDGTTLSTFTINGNMAASRLLNYVREMTTPNAVVLNREDVQERRYMSVERYMALATENA